MRTPLISIILPVYNGVYHIQEAINSVISQSYANWELFVIDDGSTDNTREIVDNFSKNDKRIRHIKNETNLGIQKTLNKGLKEAQGEYIARIDDDDVWIDNAKLGKQVEFLENNKDYVLVGTGVIVVDENKKELFRYLSPQEDKDIRKRILSKNCFAHSSVMFRKDSAFKFGRYSEEENVKHIEDYDLWLKLGTVGRFANLGTYSTIFMYRKNAISVQNRIIQAKRMYNIISKYKNIYSNFFISRIVLILRIIGFNVLRWIPLSNKSLYTIQRIYKNF